MSIGNCRTLEILLPGMKIETDNAEEIENFIHAFAISCARIKIGDTVICTNNVMGYKISEKDLSRVRRSSGFHIRKKML